MKKFLTLAAYALLAVALPVALAACGSDKDDDDTEKVAVTQIILSDTELTLTAGSDEGGTICLYNPSTATDKTMLVSSSAPSVCTARFDAEGANELVAGAVYIKPLAAGTATVTVSSRSNPDVKATIAVTVKAAGEVKPDEEPRMKYVGFYVTYPDRSHKTFPATGGEAEAQAGTTLDVHLLNYSRGSFSVYQDAVTGARWESSNTSVATVSDAASTSRNTITLRAAGTTTIRVIAPDGSQSSFTLNVTKPEQPYAITGTDGKKYRLTKVGNYAVEYDAEGELKTIAGLPRLADGRFRGGDYTLALTFKSGTHLLERLVLEKEGTQRNITTLNFQYDSKNRLVRCTDDWESNGVKEGNTKVITLTWNDEKLLSTFATGRYSSATDMQFTLFYSGNRANPTKRMGIAPVVFSGLYTNNFSVQLCAALSALGCFGEGPALLPTSRSLLYYGNTTSQNVTCTLNSAGLLTTEDFSPYWESTSQISYQYTSL
ncbi:MAG: hypothetical protein J6M53_09195 [Bacteroidaceae bacterium]|nr:hypothetical protein [Bacteroidaceae bacterium]